MTPQDTAEIKSIKKTQDESTDKTSKPMESDKMKTTKLDKDDVDSDKTISDDDSKDDDDDPDANMIRLAVVCNKKPGDYLKDFKNHYKNCLQKNPNNPNLSLFQ